MLLAVVGYLPDDIEGNAGALFVEEPFAYRGDAFGRFRLEIALLHEEPGKDTKEVEVVVASLSTIVTVYKYVV